MPKKSKMTIRQAVAKILGVSTREEILDVLRKSPLYTLHHSVEYGPEKQEAWGVIYGAYKRSLEKNTRLPVFTSNMALSWAVSEIKNTVQSERPQSEGDVTTPVKTPRKYKRDVDSSARNIDFTHQEYLRNEALRKKQPLELDQMLAGVRTIEIKERPAEWNDQIEPPQKKKKTRDDKTLTQTLRPTTVARTFQPGPPDNNCLPENGWVVFNKQKKKDK